MERSKFAHLDDHEVLIYFTIYGLKMESVGELIITPTYCSRLELEKMKSQPEFYKPQKQKRHHKLLARIQSEAPLIQKKIDLLREIDEIMNHTRQLVNL